ncbi:MAG TPA: hypothetical protein VFS40_01895 [Gemmatimonadales bacterium]|nr:hypothetical protein [Gemmatimonadales bacterium]
MPLPRPRHPRALVTAVALALATLLGAAACGDGSTGPGSLAGRYALAQVEGAALPAPIFDGTVPDPNGDFHLRVTATTGWLELTADGRYDHGVDLAVTIDDQPQPPVRWRDHGVYTVAGDSLAFDSEYIENVAFRGSIEAGRVHVVQDLSNEGPTARYTFAR